MTGEYPQPTTDGVLKEVSSPVPTEQFFDLLSQWGPLLPLLNLRLKPWLDAQKTRKNLTADLEKKLQSCKSLVQNTEAAVLTPDEELEPDSMLYHVEMCRGGIFRFTNPQLAFSTAVYDNQTNLSELGPTEQIHVENSYNHIDYIFELLDESDGTVPLRDNNHFNELRNESREAKKAIERALSKLEENRTTLGTQKVV